MVIKVDLPEGTRSKYRLPICMNLNQLADGLSIDKEIYNDIEGQAH